MRTVCVDVVRVATSVVGRGVMVGLLGLEYTPLAHDSHHRAVVAASLGAAVLAGGYACFLLKSSSKM